MDTRGQYKTHWLVAWNYLGLDELRPIPNKSVRRMSPPAPAGNSSNWRFDY